FAQLKQRVYARLVNEFHALPAILEKNHRRNLLDEFRGTADDRTIKPLRVNFEQLVILPSGLSGDKIVKPHDLDGSAGFRRARQNGGVPTGASQAGGDGVRFFRE